MGVARAMAHAMPLASQGDTCCHMLIQQMTTCPLEHLLGSRRANRLREEILEMVIQIYKILCLLITKYHAMDFEDHDGSYSIHLPVDGSCHTDMATGPNMWPLLHNLSRLFSPIFFLQMLDSTTGEVVTFATEGYRRRKLVVPI